MKDLIRTHSVELVNNLKFHPVNGTIYQDSNLGDLKASIAAVGLLSPLIVDEFNQVLSGNRRLACLLELGWEKVEISKVVVGDEDPALLIVHHNKQRIKTYRELVNEYNVLSKVHDTGQGNRSDLKTYGKSDVSSKKRNKTSRDIIAEEMSISSSQLYKLMYIDKQNPEVLDKLDKGEMTVNKAYDTLKSGMRWRLGGPRESALDFYETPKVVTRHLLRNEKFDFTQSVVEPAQGKGAITLVLKEHFSNVTAYDIEIDFLTEKNQYDLLITNPPYSRSIEFITKAKKLIRNKFCLLLPIGYLNGKRRFEFAFASKAFPLKRVIIFVPNLHLGHAKSSADTLVTGGLIGYAWYIWERGYVGDPTISWIENLVD
jgi:hypothetical protein|tara:strand:- start:100 stop:1215 length:1116 start_codon:yes stop_codon:yes gene_type:complete